MITTIGCDAVRMLWILCYCSSWKNQCGKSAVLILKVHVVKLQNYQNWLANSKYPNSQYIVNTRKAIVARANCYKKAKENTMLEVFSTQCKLY